MADRSRPTRHRALLTCFSGALTLLSCAGLLVLAVVAHAPPVVLPLIVVVCLGGPMLATFELRAAIVALRGPGADAAPLDSRSVRALRRHLDRLPEAQHPLGL